MSLEMLILLAVQISMNVRLEQITVTWMAIATTQLALLIVPVTMVTVEMASTVKVRPIIVDVRLKSIMISITVLIYFFYLAD